MGARRARRRVSEWGHAGRREQHTMSVWEVNRALDLGSPAEQDAAACSNELAFLPSLNSASDSVLDESVV